MKQIILNNGAGGLKLDYYAPQEQKSDIALVIFPGGAYVGLADNEGKDYAEYFSALGLTCFVVNYRVYPDRFPAQLIDARLAIRFIRYNAENFNISKDKIVVVGSSAGGHLAALVSTYRGDINESTGVYSDESYIPNGQVLCYPVISSDESISHKASFERLLGENYNSQKDLISPELLVDKTTPPAFLWHTKMDEGVSVFNSVRYAAALESEGVPVKFYVFPNGPHGMGLAKGDEQVSMWTQFLLTWLKTFFDFVT